MALEFSVPFPAVFPTSWFTCRRASDGQVQLVGSVPDPRLGKNQAMTLRLRNGIIEFLSRLDPEVRRGVDVGQCFLVGTAVRQTPGEFWYFSHESIVIRAPVNNDFILVH